jgi:hypothetical protein
MQEGNAVQPADVQGYVHPNSISFAIEAEDIAEP